MRIADNLILLSGIAASVSANANTVTTPTSISIPSIENPQPSTIPSPSLEDTNHNTSNNENENSQKKNGMPSLITLDLAGELQTHVTSPSLMTPDGIEVGPANHDGSRTNPLFRWGQVQVPTTHNGHGIMGKIPMVHVGAKYDFKRVWYGATRLMTNLSWGSGSGSGIGTNRISTIRGEVGLIHPNDYSMHLALKFPPSLGDKQLPSRSQTQLHNPERMVSVRYDTRSFGTGHDPSATVAASTLIHPRLGVVFKGIVLLGKSGFRATPATAPVQFMNRIPQEEVKWSEGSWLPDVKMSPGGKIISNSAIGLKRNGSTQNRIGVRLMISRKLNWDIIGMFHGGDETQYDNDTTLRLEVGGVGSDHYSSISAEAAIERIPETLRCTLLQEKIFSI